MTKKELALVADAYVRTSLGSGFTVDQLIDYVEQTKRSPELVQAIKMVRKYD
jgi:hypothetical protein